MIESTTYGSSVVRDDPRIGILVNNAGTAIGESFIEQGTGDEARLVALNTTAVLRLASAIAPRLAKAGEGAIVNIGSVVGLAPEFGMTVYGATKAFVLFLSQGLSLELGPKGVVTDAVHAKGGRIFIQLWHVGRVSHVDLHGGEAPVAPSAIRAETKTFVNNGFADVSEPRALELEEIPAIVEDFRKAAANAIKASFDGVEVHGANGYLLDQFLRETANVRTNAYGGSIENRARLLIEVTAAVASEIGAQHTGVRLSPVSPASGIVPSSDGQPQFNHVMEALDRLGIAYIHVVEGATRGPRDARPFDFDSLKQRFSNTYIANNGYNLELAKARLAEGKADLFAFGHDYIANPDLVERFKSGAPLAQMNPATIYGGGAEGYTDYPAAAVTADA